MSRSRQYPDITDVLAQKARGRQERASLRFAEKLEILDKLRKGMAPIVQARAREVGALPGGNEPFAGQHGGIDKTGRLTAHHSITYAEVRRQSFQLVHFQ